MFTVSGSFVDPGADTWTATVDYGDGSGPQPLELDGNTFTLSHVYATAGWYGIWITIQDGSEYSWGGYAGVSVDVRNVARGERRGRHHLPRLRVQHDGHVHGSRNRGMVGVGGLR